MSNVTFYYPALVPDIYIYTSTAGEPIGVLKGDFWLIRLKRWLGEESVQPLQDGVRLDKFLTVVGPVTDFTNNLITLMPRIRHEIFTWAYFRSYDLIHGNFEHGNEVARRFLWKVIPTCYDGTIILQVNGTAVDRGGEIIHGKLKCWRVDDEDLSAGCVTLHGRSTSFTFKWSDIEENRVKIPQWHDLMRDMCLEARRGGEVAIGRLLQ